MAERLSDEQVRAEVPYPGCPSHYPAREPTCAVCAICDLAAEALARGADLAAEKAAREKAEAQIEADADALLMVTKRAEKAEERASIGQEVLEAIAKVTGLDLRAIAEDPSVLLNRAIKAEAELMAAEDKAHEAEIAAGQEEDRCAAIMRRAKEAEAERDEARAQAAGMRECLTEWRRTEFFDDEGEWEAWRKRLAVKADAALSGDAGRALLDEREAWRTLLDSTRIQLRRAIGALASGGGTGHEVARLTNAADRIDAALAAGGKEGK